MKRLKVLTIVGTRPELIKLCRVIEKLDAYTNHKLVHTGQNYDYELNEVFFQDLGIRQPHYFLDATGKSLAETIGNIIAKSDVVLAKEQPEAVLLLGDTNSCLSAIAAKRRQIPIFHMEAGNRCFDQRVPEEINRKIVDHISDINMPYTEHARRYLLNEGLKNQTIIKTGSPMQEVLKHYMPKIKISNVLEQMAIRPREYFVVSAHREENVDNESNLDELLHSLNAIAIKYDMPIVFSTHPRTKKRLKAMDSFVKLDSRILFVKPLGFFDYIKLQINAFCVLSDSGTITEESSILGFPAVTIRETHERPEGMDEGTLIMCGLKRKRVLQSIEIVTSQFNRDKRLFRLVQDYEPENVSEKVVRIIMSYVDYVNRNVWFKLD